MLEQQALEKMDKYLARVREDVPKLSKQKHFKAAERVKFNAYKAIEQLRFIVQVANAS